MQPFGAFHLFAVAQGIGLLGAILLWQQQSDRVLKILFSGLIVALMAIAMTPQLVEYKEQWISVAIAILLPAFFCIPVLYWWLIQYLTSTQLQFPVETLYRHCILPIIASLVSVVLLLLPEASISAIFLNESASLSMMETAILLSVFALFIAWLGFSLGYLLSIVRRLIWYRKQLPEVFSNMTGKDLRWLDWHGILLVLSWGLLAAGYFDGLTQIHILTMLVGGLLLVIFMLILTVWGITQSPGFAQLQDETEDLQQILSVSEQTHRSEQANSAQYQSSALSEVDMQKFAERLKISMQKQAFLDPDITMPSLAKMSGVPVNYVSQVLSQGFGCNFYQWINSYRIEHAQHLMQGSQDTVLSIALASGFNTRSAFYNAFKAKTGMTPGEFKRAQ